MAESQNKFVEMKKAENDQRHAGLFFRMRGWLQARKWHLCAVSLTVFIFSFRSIKIEILQSTVASFFFLFQVHIWIWGIQLWKL